MVWPLTVMVLPAAKLVPSEFVPAAPDNSVVAAIGANAMAWLLTTLPVALPLAVLIAALKPSAAKVAGAELVTDRVPALSFSVITPPAAVDGVAVPVIWSIAVRTS